MKFTVYTDGSVAPTNPGPGGWAAAVLVGKKVILMHGRHERRKTTSNRMELMGILESLRALPDRSDVMIFSDSKWALGAIFDESWHVKKNLDLLGEIENQVSRMFNVRGRHVKGHAGDDWNEIVDTLARTGLDSIPHTEEVYGLELTVVSFLEEYYPPAKTYAPRHHFILPQDTFRITAH